jgi:hypothetical protein
MTKGVVQRVLGKYRPLRKANGNYPYFTPKIFSQIEKELIAEINKASFERELTPRKQAIVLLYDLIGDNQ